MDVVLITEQKNPKWEKIIRKHVPDCKLTISDRNFDQDFGDYDLSVIDIPHPIMTEDSVKDAVPTLCTTLPNKNTERVARLSEISEYTGAPFMMADPIISSPTLHTTLEAGGNIGKVKHVNISFSDPNTNKNEDVSWTVGYQVFCTLWGILNLLDNHEEIDGWGLQGAGFYKSDLHNWISASFFIKNKGEVDSSVNMYISNIEEKHKKISIIGTEGLVECFPCEKEVRIKDVKGRNRSVLDTSCLTWEEHSLVFLLENLENSNINGQVGDYAVFMCNEILTALSAQEEHINLS